VAQQDYYEVLGVSHEATPEEVKKAYHRLAVKFHPDKNQGDAAAEEQFKAVSEAYQVLGQPEKRAQYDRFGHAGVGGGAGPGTAFDPMDVFREFARRHSAFGGFEDLFSSFMGGGFEGRRTSTAQRRRGEDLRLALPLSLEEIAHGVEKQVRLKRQVACASCGGSGAKPGGRTVRCSQCDGTGEIKIIQRVLWGQVIRTEPCRRCDGEGSVIEDPCPDCGGAGRQIQEEQIALKIPRGVADGERLAKRGAGNAGRRGGPPGDLVIEIHERSHELFERRGLDLVIRLPISLSQAALGMRYTLGTLEGSVEVKVPAGIQSGKMLRLRGRGLAAGNQRGDLFVVVQVWTPQKLSKRERELLEELGQLPGLRAPRPGKGLLEKFKDAFRG